MVNKLKYLYTAIINCFIVEITCIFGLTQLSRSPVFIDEAPFSTDWSSNETVMNPQNNLSYHGYFGLNQSLSRTFILLNENASSGTILSTISYDGTSSVVLRYELIFGCGIDIDDTVTVYMQFDDQISSISTLTDHIHQ